LQEYSIFHFFGGIGGVALGFQQGEAEYRGVKARFRTLGAVDVDPLACRDFESLTGHKETELDLFTKEDYTAFHGHAPEANWHEATAQDVRRAAHGKCPDVIFLSPPCKGFTGLLPKAKAASPKYQALNRLVIRGLALAL
jgi:site-specific DNA-cytosine methylase